MKPHYDFSKAERGKFYRKGARVRLPIYLDGQLQQRLERIAEKKGRDVGDGIYCPPHPAAIITICAL